MKCDCIAVLENTDNSITAMESCTHLSVWQRDWSTGKGWHACDPAPFSLEGCETLAQMRERLRQLAHLLPEQAAIAGTSISGLAYNELSRMGFCLCELDTFSPQILDALASEILASAQGEVQVPTAPTPTDTPGVYTINLMEVQAAHPDITSKKALRRGNTVFFQQAAILRGAVWPAREHMRSAYRAVGGQHGFKLQGGTHNVS